MNSTAARNGLLTDHQVIEVIFIFFLMEIPLTDVLSILFALLCFAQTVVDCVAYNSVKIKGLNRESELHKL